MLGRGRAQVCGSAGVFEDRKSRCTEKREEGVSVDPAHVRHETESLPSGFPLFPEAADSDGWGRHLRLTPASPTVAGFRPPWTPARGCEAPPLRLRLWGSPHASRRSWAPQNQEVSASIVHAQGTTGSSGRMRWGVTSSHREEARGQKGRVTEAQTWPVGSSCVASLC